MELEDAKEIAEYALRRLLRDLPQDTKRQLLRAREGEESMKDRLEAQLARDIQWMAAHIQAARQERYL
jgi:hypothetical protein